MLDNVDYKILDLLKENSRLSYAEIGRMIGLSRVAVRSRVEGMVRQGVIEKFTVLVNGDFLGKRLSVFMEVEVESPLIQEAGRHLASRPEVAVVYEMTGSSALHVHVFAPSVLALQNFIEKEVYTLRGLRSVRTHILTRRYKSDLSTRV
ncbi:Lrp/AsnC family transcriptional regulator [Geochorda subterranea]|uniref:Lrp/AsnC family transcriptional regulator n=1 Tax=Geochorda subterranea TaxID=3109564 RepID=A0ABZ1BQZ2_9FIRM|nr:Lrp/AsnC family transcriptional regulator [Limnochorda sp. LNt]WRP15242.1 Lrp/AsnC family transcriptional regulator [Limnochorda sp. LNt]